jgi:hypothetical protein
MVCCAVVVATALWAGSASARNWNNNTLFHDSDNQNLCFNNPYQSSNNGNQLVVSAHCDYSDPGSAMLVEYHNGYIELSFQTSTVLNIIHASPEKCMDDRYGVQQDFNPIVIWDCNDGATQQWDLTSAGELRYHVNPQYCATVNNGNFTLALYRCLGVTNQKFVVTKEQFTRDDFNKCYSEKYFQNTRQCNIANNNGGNAGCYSVAGNRAYQQCENALGISGPM